MKAICQLILPVFLAVSAFTPIAAHALGSDYFTNQVNNPDWSKGLGALVNSTNRVHGFFVNAEDIFFFRGDAATFETFLNDYSRIAGVTKHQVVLHDGAGEAKSPWAKTGQPCDWSLYACPQAWLDPFNTHKPSVATNYVITVNFWTGGKIPFEKIKVPSNVEVVRQH